MYISMNLNMCMNTYNYVQVYGHVQYNYLYKFAYMFKFDVHSTCTCTFTCTCAYFCMYNITEAEKFGISNINSGRIPYRRNSVDTIGVMKVRE
jgi:hypothetical protein